LADNNKKQEPDWLEGNVEEQQAQQRIKGLEIAQMYLVFVDTPRARQLLEDWEERMVRKVTPAESTIQRYAADNAVRGFIQGIRDQIKIAQEFRE